MNEDNTTSTRMAPPTAQAVAPPAVTESYRRSLLELTSLDGGDDVDVAAQAMLKAHLTEPEILAALYLSAMKLYSQAITTMTLDTREATPPAVWTAASTVHEDAETRLGKWCKSQALSHRGLVPQRFAPAGEYGHVTLLPTLAYSLTNDVRNEEAMTVRLGNANVNDGTIVLSPGESTTITGKDGVGVMGGSEPILVTWSRVGGDYTAGTLGSLMQIKRMAKVETPEVKPMPKRKWLW